MIVNAIGMKILRKVIQYVLSILFTIKKIVIINGVGGFLDFIFSDFSYQSTSRTSQTWMKNVHFSWTNYWVLVVFI